MTDTGPGAAPVRLGPPIVRRCRACSATFEEIDRVFVSADGMRFWTDFKVYAPEMPERPLLVRCGSCRALVWVPDAERAGPLRKRAEAAIPPVPYEEPTEAELASLLRTTRDPERVLYLRQRLWWFGNDPRRVGPPMIDRDVPPVPGVPPLGASERENLEALVAVVDELPRINRFTASTHVLLQVEALRELGRFAEARARIELVDSRTHFGAVAELYAFLIDARDVVVREVAMR